MSTFLYRTSLVIVVSVLLGAFLGSLGLAWNIWYGLGVLAGIFASDLSRWFHEWMVQR